MSTISAVGKYDSVWKVISTGLNILWEKTTDIIESPDWYKTTEPDIQGYNKAHLPVIQFRGYD